MTSDAEGRTRRIDAPAHRWLAPTLGAVLLIAAGLDLFRLWRDGDGNLYYAAAVKSMLTGWHPFFFVAFDPAGFISVDKPPLGLWVQTASAKLFGFHGLSLLLPQALAGVLSVALLYVLVRRSCGPLAGVVAALALALTPISVATNRNNTMDSLLVLLVLVAAYAVSHAAETGRLRPLLLCAALVGLGFNVKMLQAYLVLPAFALTYLIGAPLRRSRRLAHLALATVVLVVVSLSWAVVVELTPASERPFIGSSGDNSAWDLILGYNGLDRVIPGAFPASGQQLGFAAGAPGVLRLLNHQLAGQVSWLLLPAIAGLVIACWRTHWRVPFDRSQQALVLWGTWFITQGVFFSVAGLFHPYYLVMLAPAIAALTGIGAVTLWRDYRRPGARGWLLPVVLLTAALLQAGILADFPAWSRWLTPVVVGLCALAAAALTLARIAPQPWGYAQVVGVTLIGGLALLVAPAAWAVIPVWHAGNVDLPVAGPEVISSPDAQPPADTSAVDVFSRYLLANRGQAHYLLATRYTGLAAPIILATGQPVMAYGGYVGNDPALTTTRLTRLVAGGAVRLFWLLSPQDAAQNAVDTWVRSRCTQVHSAPGFGPSGPQLFDCAH